MQIGDVSRFNAMPEQPVRSGEAAAPLAAPVDAFVSQATGRSPIPSFTDVLSIRVPTTMKDMTEERRQKIISTLQAGDIILETNNAYPGWQRFEMLTLKSSYTHAALYEGNGKFLEATTPSEPGGAGVIRSDVEGYFGGPQLVEIIRPPYKTPEDREAALDYARSQLGKPYDDRFTLDDDGKAQYCAELVYRSLLACPNRIETPLVSFFGRKAVGPDSFEGIEGAQIAYSDHSNFWKNMATHWPVALGAAATSAAAGLALGPVGGVAGFFGGLLFSIALGNKIQTGHFNLAGGDSK